MKYWNHNHSLSMENSENKNATLLWYYSTAVRVRNALNPEYKWVKSPGIIENRRHHHIVPH